MLNHPISAIGILAAALIAMPANAQVSQSKSTENVPTPTGTATVRTSTKTDASHDRSKERTEVKSSDLAGTHHYVRKCKTRWSHGQRVRSCKASVRHQS